MYRIVNNMIKNYTDDLMDENKREYVPMRINFTDDMERKKSKEI